MFEDAKQQIAAMPQPVQLWMRWLNIVFLLGVFFAWSEVEARWALAAYFVSFPVGFGAFYFFRDIRITGLPHILIWGPLVGFLVHSAANDPDYRVISLYGCWVSLLCLTIAISIILDIKGIKDALFS